MEKVTIIIPVYNCEKFITQTIESVKKQTYTNWELIIVNDGSNDGSFEKIIEATHDIKSKTRIIDLIENQGVANARNIALEKAQGRYIAFLDADDLWESEKLSKQLEFMQGRDIGFSYTSYERIKEDGKFIKNVIIPHQIDYKELLKNTIMLTSTVLIDTEKIEKQLLKMPDIKMSEDTQTWLNILSYGIIAYGLDECLVKYRKRKGSISSNKFKSIIGIWKVYKDYQKISTIKCIYYTTMHTFNAIKKRVPIRL